ncbi:hypothetical protein ACF3NT_05470 [Naumannella halotolerans]|uniref:hypothetical protein n=1 Tax=Naumannella halotolerans TaxID=993414 RepID=UPI00370D1313
MIRNLILFTLGAVTGVLLFRWLLRKFDQLVAQARPDAIVSRVARSAQNAGDQVADFIDDVRVNTRRRESELRAELGMAPVLDPDEVVPQARRQA